MRFLDTNVSPHVEVIRPNWTSDGKTPVADSVLIQAGYYPLLTEQPQDTMLQRFARDGYIVETEQAHVRFTAQDRTLDEAKTWLKDRVGTLRKAKEQGGVILNGALIATDRESQGMIHGARTLAQTDPEATIDFKAQSGWVTLTASEMQVIGIAVARHVRDCFARERSLCEAIDACEDFETLAAIDVNGGWPS